MSIKSIFEIFSPLESEKQKERVAVQVDQNVSTISKKTTEQNSFN